MPSMIAKEMVDSSCEDAPVIVVSIAAIADQADLSPASLTGSLTVNGVAAIPDAWAWRVNGATTGIGDATDPTTVFIPTTGGTYVATLAASIYGEWRYAEQEAFVVGSGLLTLSIDAISDQSTLNPISFNSTASGGVGTKTYSWLVNGSTSGLSSATAADPTFTPTVAGEHTAVCTITDEAGQTKTTTRSFTIGTGALSVSIAAVSDQLGLTAATLDSTVSNAVGSVTYAWTVDDATTGLSSSTAADPTYTPTTAGKHTAVVTATDAAGQVAKATVTWTVGDADGRVQTHGVIWANETPGALNTTYTADGITYTEQSGTLVIGASGLEQAASSANDTPANDAGPRALTDEDDVVFYLAVDASISGATHASTFNILNAAGTERGGAKLSHSGATHQVEVLQVRAGATTLVTKAVASQARVVALRWFRGILFEVRYSLTAFSGTWPAFSTMTEVFTTNGTNSFTPIDASGATDHAPAPLLTAGTLLRHSNAGNTRFEQARAIFVKSAL